MAHTHVDANVFVDKDTEIHCDKHFDHDSYFVLQIGDVSRSHLTLFINGTEVERFMRILREAMWKPYELEARHEQAQTATE